MSAYFRKMALDGYCVRLETKDIKEMVSLLRYCSNNLNQYARKANGMGVVYQSNMKDIPTLKIHLWLHARREGHASKGDKYRYYLHDVITIKEEEIPSKTESRTKISKVNSKWEIQMDLEVIICYNL